MYAFEQEMIRISHAINLYHTARKDHNKLITITAMPGLVFDTWCRVRCIYAGNMVPLHALCTALHGVFSFVPVPTYVVYFTSSTAVD